MGRAVFVFVELDGERMLLQRAAEELGCKDAIYRRIRRGWTPQRAVNFYRARATWLIEDEHGRKRLYPPA